MSRDSDSFQVSDRNPVLSKDTAAKILGKRSVRHPQLGKDVLKMLNNNWLTVPEVRARLNSSGSHTEPLTDNEVSNSLSYLARNNKISRMGTRGSFKYRKPSGAVAEAATPSHRLAVIAKKLDELEAERSRLKHEAKLLAQKL